VDLKTLALRLASSHREEVTPLIPIAPKEVWGAGCTYEISSSFRDAEHGTREGFYRAVFEGGRPELFFKGTSRIAVGPGQPIGIREDSKFTAPEPELAVLIGSKGQIFGYTVSNDVSAWDIEKENPLYLPQSKTFTGCAAIGPVFVTPDELGNVYDLEMTCVIHRGDRVTFEGKTSTAKLGRKIEELIGFLLRSNPVPCGTVLQTGTGIIVTQESALAPGDVVTISVPQIGTLSNPAAIV
jgi:2-dehydro-3-deoxy-D-arabinonate dehydratase